jgi:DNA-binding MarR family transcriptional regulator
MTKRVLLLSDADLASVRRVLTDLTHAPQAPGHTPREKLIDRARMSLALRRRRTEFLNRAMFGEPAYEMLLTLYVEEGEEITAARLAEMTGIAQSSALRWIDYLVSKQLVRRERHPTDKRALVVKLSSKGRSALDGLFESFPEIGLDTAAG